MSEPSIRRFYWDTTCFICLLNEDEQDRRYICTDILRHAELGDVEIWTSAVTMSEVIRPRDKFTPFPLPEWCTPILEKFPLIEPEIRKLWDFFKRRTMPTRQLSEQEIKAIQALFDADWIKLIHLDERTAKEAVEISRKFKLRPMDAIHAASACLKKPQIDAFHYFDKDYEAIRGLVPLAEPTRISSQEEFKQFIPPITQVK